jgi:hypothetical protein
MRRFQVLAMYVLAVMLALSLSIGIVSSLRSAAEVYDEDLSSVGGPAGPP